MKKKLLWIIIAIIAIAALAIGGALLILKPEKNPEAPTAATSQVKIYWNVDRASYQPDTGLTRLKNGDYYRATFAVDGEQVDLFFDNYATLEYADTLQYMGMVVDENNVVQQILEIESFTGGLACLNAYVETPGDQLILCNTALNFRELPIKLKLNENSRFYYMDDAGGPLVGMPTEPQKGARITAIQDEQGYVICAYVEPPFDEKPVYYNKDRMYDSVTKMTTRDSDALGVYTITFAVDGQLVDLKCKDQKLVNLIDSYATMCMHLEFDEEGYINNVAGAWHATGAWSSISWCYVTEITERYFVAQDNQGNSFTGYFADNVKIFHVDKRAENFGEYTQLQIGDRVHCSCNKGKDINVIFVNQRVPDMDIYWNVCRMYHSQAKKTNRVADKNGWYYFTVAVNGQQKEVRTDSYELANKIDSYPAKCFALKLEGDVIKDVIDPWSTLNGSTWGSWVNVTDIAEDGTVTAVKLSGNKVTDTLTGKLAENYKAYNVTSDALFIGVETTLREGDQIHALKDRSGNIITAFVVSRPMDCELYFNLDRKYDSATKTTTRVPDAAGYYSFTMAVNGKQVVLKTKSSSIATQIDQVATRAVGLKIRGDEIVKVYADNKVEGYTGGRKAAWYTLTALDGKKLTAENKNTSDADFGWIYNGTMAFSCPVYNCSSSIVNFRGEKTTLKLGDTIMCMHDGNGKIALVYVVGRKDDVPIYWNVDKMWDSTAMVSTRTPDADGWYWFTMAIDGQHVKLKTNDKTIVDTIDGRVVDCIGLVTDGDRITRTVMPWKAEATIGGDFGSWTNVIGLGENGLIKTIKVSSGSDNGKLFTGTMQENCQVFDVSAGAEVEGQLSDLRLGDLIHGLADKNGDPRIIYIISRTEAHSSNHCSCGGTLDSHAKAMHNEADGSGSNGTYVKGGAIALTGSSTTFTMTGGEIIGGNVPYGRGGAVYVAGKNNTITGGRISGGNAAYGGNIFSYSGELTIGGSAVIEGGTASTNGGNIYIFGGAFQLKDRAKISGGITDGTASGGSIFLRWGSGAKMTMNGGTVTGGTAGTAAGKGECGNIYVGYNTTLTINNGTITGGKAKNGGNVGSYGTIVMNGGTITGGVASGYGGNISLYMDTETNPPATLTVNGGSIEGGTAGTGGGNVRMGKNCTLTLLGGEIKNGQTSGNGGNIWVGQAVTKNGATCYCTLVLTGGSVTGGTAAVGGGVYAYYSSVIQQGSSIVTDNTGGDIYQEP